MVSKIEASMNAGHKISKWKYFWKKRLDSFGTLIFISGHILGSVTAYQTLWVVISLLLIFKGIRIPTINKEPLPLSPSGRNNPFVDAIQVLLHLITHPEIAHLCGIHLAMPTREPAD
jgi:hypothetical protein